MAWDSTKVDGVDQLPASEWNTHVTDQKGHSSRHITGGSDALHTNPFNQATRVQGTVYQNGVNYRLIIISMALGTSGLIQVYSDASNPPTTEIMRSNTQTSTNQAIVVFIVAPNNYWKAVNTSGTINFTQEYDLI